MTVLGLTAGTYEKHHEGTGDAKGLFVAMVFFDQCERQIYSGGNPRGGIDSSILQKNWCGIYQNGGVVSLQTIAETPVRDRVFAIEEACFRKDERPVQMEAIRRQL